ncbi:MAG: ACT domain-containing protein, partial [Nitrospinota bacterium]
GLAELVREGLLSREEVEEAQAAYDFLLRVRNELHLRARAKREVLTFGAQAEVAPALGYRDEESATAGEQLMRQYFLRARTLFQTSRVFLDACEERFRDGRWRRPRIERLRGGLVLVNYHTLSLDGDGKALLEEPAGLMRVFEQQQRFGCRLGRNLKEFVRRNLHRVDDAFRSSAHVRDSFLNILREHSDVARTLRSMHELGFLGRYIPEFEGLTCFVQYDHYHRYTADEHTLFTQAKLDELAVTKELSLQEFGRIFKELERPHLLRLALLLHDLGKARGPRHVHRSAVMVPPIVIRMGLPADEGRLVEFLTGHHIAMSRTAERRDMEDPKLIREFAAEAGTVERLNMLYLLTYADISAVAPGMWNEWRQALLHELYWKARQVLTERGAASWLKVREEVRTRVLYEMRAGGIRAEEDEVDAHLRLMPEKYLATTPPQDILRHILMVRRLRTEPLVLEVSHRRRMGNSQVTICCPDRLGLFAMLAGTFAAHEISILETQVYTREDGVALDVFQVVGAEGGSVTEEAIWAGVEARLRELLEGRLTMEELVERRRDFLRPKWRVHFEVPTVVEYDNAISDRYTVVDVFTADRVGLLYQIARTLSEEGVSISLAKISTEGVRAIDVFYVTDADGGKIADRGRLERLREVLLQRLAPEASAEVRV